MSKKILVNLDLMGNQLQNASIQPLAIAPANPKLGQIYYNTTDNKLYSFDGTQWNVVGADVSDASETVKGIIELATQAEVTAGTDAVRAVTPKTLKTELDKKVTVGTIKLADVTDVTATATEVNYLDGVTSNVQTQLDAKIPSSEKGAANGVATLDANALIPEAQLPDLSGTYINVNQKGVADGVATLDDTGKVPAAQLPSYVDDVVDSYIVAGSTALSAGWLSATAGGTAFTPETGKIYVVLTEGVYLNKTYRWSGTTYVEISSSPAQATETSAGIAAIATTAEVEAGTNDTKFVTPLKLQGKISGLKVTQTNPDLTPVGGIATWSISNTIGSADVLVQVVEVATGDVVVTDVNVSASAVTVKINASAVVAAGTYKAIVIGL